MWLVALLISALFSVPFGQVFEEPETQGGVRVPPRKGLPIRVLYDKEDGSIVSAMEILGEGLTERGFFPGFAPFSGGSLSGMKGSAASPVVLIGKVDVLRPFLPEGSLPVEPRSYRIIVSDPFTAMAVGADEEGVRLAAVRLAHKTDLERQFADVATIVSTPRFPIRMISVDLRVGTGIEKYVKDEDLQRRFLSLMARTGFNRIVLPLDGVTRESASIAAGKGIAVIARIHDEAGMDPDKTTRVLSDLLEKAPAVRGIEIARPLVESASFEGWIRVVGERFPELEIQLELLDLRELPGNLGSALREVRSPLRIRISRPQDVPRLEAALGNLASATRGVILESPPNPYRLFRWADPAFTLDFMATAKAAGATGYSVPVNEWQMVRDETLSEFGRETCRNWEYRFEKDRLRFRIWGLLGADPGVNEETVQGWFVEKYGKETGEVLFDSLVAASRVLTHWGRYYPLILQDRIFPEGLFLGAVEPIAATGEAVSGPFLTIADLIEAKVDPVFVLSIPEFAGMKVSGYPAERDPRTSPEELADELETLIAKAREVRRQLLTAPSSKADLNELRGLDLELQMIAHLGKVYVHLLRAAPHAVMAGITGKEEIYKASEEEIGQASEEWASLSRLGNTLFVPLKSGAGVFKWDEGRSAFVGSSSWVRAGVSGGRFVPWTCRVTGPIPLGSRYLEAFEKGVCSATDAAVVDTGFRSGNVTLDWREAEVIVFDGTPESMPSWVKQTETYTRFLSGRRYFPAAHEGALYGEWEIVSDTAGTAQVKCPVGSLVRAWANGNLIFDRESDSADLLEKGIRVPLSAGRNIFIFRSDLKPGDSSAAETNQQEQPWGFAPRIDVITQRREP